MHGTQRHDRHEPAARVGGRTQGAAGRRQRDRRRGHRRRGARGRRADDERHRRRPVRDRLRREDEDAARAQRERTLRATPRRPRRSPRAGSDAHARRRRATRSSCPASSTAGRSCSRSTARSRWRARSTPAIGYAKNGYAVSEIISDQWQASEKKLRRDPGRGGDVPARRPRAEAGRVFANPHLAASLELIAQGRPRRVLQGTDRARHRRRHEEARRPARRRATSPSTRPTGSSRSRRPIAATTCTSCRRTRRASSSLEMLNILEGFDLKALGPQLRRVSAPARRSQADRVRRSRRVPRRSRSVPPAVLKMLISKEYAARAAQGDRSGSRGGQRYKRRRRSACAARARPMQEPQTSPDTIAATRST